MNRCKFFDGRKDSFQFLAINFVIKKLQSYKNSVLTFCLCKAGLVNFPNFGFRMKDTLSFFN